MKRKRKRHGRRARTTKKNSYRKYGVRRNFKKYSKLHHNNRRRRSRRGKR